ncbi:hypothetical protein L3X37_13810 [Sabulilitoribacter arenilitoris]|uniref:Uncharacterized protein n=1 Tax=Wocania arenilitoris TaxID=2044858 RepID=A0AAE3JQQ3_9FLAO|nr:hypothetical protein [Wocania arenilitoris]MCF7569425.1 hypothetical protein [Wocania arenilitoris]
MLLKTFISGYIPLASQTDIVTILIVVVVFFSFLLILGVRKSYFLKKENDRLNKMNTTIEDEKEKPYKDFTDGHMYGGN